MAEISSYSTTTPADTALEGDGAGAVRDLADSIKDRVGLDHNFAGNLDPANANCDGYHNKVTLKPLSSDPTLLTDGVCLYSKDFDESVTGDLTSGSAIIINISDTSSLIAGMDIIGTGIPDDTTIVSIDSSSQITISANATATSATVALTCSYVGVFFRNSLGITQIL